MSSSSKSNDVRKNVALVRLVLLDCLEDFKKCESVFYSLLQLSEEDLQEVATEMEAMNENGEFGEGPKISWDEFDSTEFADRYLGFEGKLTLDQLHAIFRHPEALAALPQKFPPDQEFEAEYKDPDFDPWDFFHQYF